MVALERRLDNIAFRAGYAPTIRAARQMVGHGHLTVNGRKVDIPSYEVRTGDVVSIRENSKMKAHIVEARKDPMNLPQPEWLGPRKEEEVKMNMLPARDTVPFELNEQLVVEYTLAARTSPKLKIKPLWHIVRAVFFYVLAHPPLKRKNYGKNNYRPGCRCGSKYDSID